MKQSRCAVGAPGIPWELSGEAVQTAGARSGANTATRVDGRTRKAKAYQRLLAEWIAALTPAPRPTRTATEFEGGGTPFEKKTGVAKIDPVRMALIERGVCLEMRIRDLEADLLAGRAVESVTFERLTRCWLEIRARLGLDRPGKVSPQPKHRGKPGPKPSNVSTHARAVLKATGGEP